MIVPCTSCANDIDLPAEGIESDPLCDGCSSRIPTGRYFIRIEGIAFFVAITHQDSKRRWTTIRIAQPSASPAWALIWDPMCRHDILHRLRLVDLDTVSYLYNVYNGREPWVS